MLPFTTVHALTGCLIDAEARAEQALGGDHPPLLLLVRERPARHPHATGDWRQIQAVGLPTLSAQTLAAPAPLPNLLHALAETIAERSTGAGTPIPTDPHTRLLGCAIVYHDISIDDFSTGNVSPGAAALRHVRRVDGVDIDDRVYRVTRRPGERHPVALIDDQPEPRDTPATKPALTALLAALRTGTTTGGRR